MTVKIVTEDYLKKMENNIINAFINHTKIDNSKYVTKEEAFRILGCAETTLATLRAERKIEFVRVGKEFQYLRTSLSKYLKQKSLQVVE
jgi:hypothetical protein